MKFINNNPEENLLIGQFHQMSHLKKILSNKILKNLKIKYLPNLFKIIIALIYLIQKNLLKPLIFLIIRIEILKNLNPFFFCKKGFH